MGTENFVNVTEGSGKKLHTRNRTIGANDVHAEAGFQAEHDYASYMVAILTGAPAANDHLISIQAGASLHLRIRSIYVKQAGNAAAASAQVIELRRIATVAHLTGTAVTPSPLDDADAASGFTARSIPGTKGTEGVLIGSRSLAIRQALLTTAAQADPELYWDFDRLREKSLTVTAGSNNGIAVKITGATSATFNIEVVVTEQNYK